VGPASGCPGMPSSSRSHRAANSSGSRSRRPVPKPVSRPTKHASSIRSKPARSGKPTPSGKPKKAGAPKRPTAAPKPAKPAAPSGARPAGGRAAPPAPRPSLLGAEPRRHVLSLAFLRDGDDFFARIETDAGQITELKHRALDQLLSLVAGELEDLLE